MPLVKNPPAITKVFFDYKNEPAPNNDENFARFHVYGMFDGPMNLGDPEQVIELP